MGLGMGAVIAVNWLEGKEAVTRAYKWYLSGTFQGKIGI